jgi:hypothetical protein
MSIQLYGPISVYHYDFIGTLSTWLEFIWFVDQQMMVCIAAYCLFIDQSLEIVTYKC